MSQIWVIVPAAGVGRRCNTSEPKQFLKLNNRLLFLNTLECFVREPSIAGIVLVSDLPGSVLSDPHWVEFKHLHQHRLIVTAGSDERVWSVQAGLKALVEAFHPEARDYVLVHDGARPCLHYEDLRQIVEQIQQQSPDQKCGYMLGRQVSDSIKRVERGVVQANLDRRCLWQAQTPQGFPLEVLQQAYELVEQQPDGCLPTDECQLVSLLGVQIKVVEAIHVNPKITTADDIPYVRQLLAQ